MVISDSLTPSSSADILSAKFAYSPTWGASKERTLRFDARNAMKKSNLTSKSQSWRTFTNSPSLISSSRSTTKKKLLWRREFKFSFLTSISKQSSINSIFQLVRSLWYFSISSKKKRTQKKPRKVSAVEVALENQGNSEYQLWKVYITHLFRIALHWIQESSRWEK